MNRHITAPEPVWGYYFINAKRIVVHAVTVK